jgi:3-phenylpropionate/cinnamic acid dioxygenase small subunit
MEQAEINYQTAATKAACEAGTGKSVRYGEPLYNDLVHFLIEEAHLLDTAQYKQWVELLADDLMVTMPVRQTVNRKRTETRSQLYWLFDDKEATTFKALRYLGDSAWADDPPSRLRRMITNVRVHETAVPGEYLVQSYLLLQRNSGNQHHFATFSARRDDILRRNGTGWLIARRDILVDQAVIGQPNLGFVI